MVTKPKKKKKQIATQKIAITMRKPALPESDKFDRAVGFAQKKDSGAESELVGSASQAVLASESESFVSTKETHSKLSMASAWTLMPGSDDERKILRRRAKTISRQKVQSQVGEREQYIRFKVGLSELYGVPYSYTEEILPAIMITRVPCTPSIIAGIVNYRGELLTVVDLQQLFGSRKSEYDTEKSSIIVVKDGKLKVGLKVDEIEDNDEYVTANLVPPINNDCHISGIHNGKVAILEITSLLSDPALYTANSV